MSDETEIDRLRDHSHELRETVGFAVTAIAVVQKEQEFRGKQLDRIEAAITPLAFDVTTLKTRADDARSAGGKWGSLTGSIGGLIGGFVAGLFKPGA